MASYSSVFCDADGNAVTEGALVRNTKLADFLEMIGEKGPDYLYNSSLTDIVVKEINDQGMAVYRQVVNRSLISLHSWY